MTFAGTNGPLPDLFRHILGIPCPQVPAVEGEEPQAIPVRYGGESGVIQPCQVPETKPIGHSAHQPAANIIYEAESGKAEIAFRRDQDIGRIQVPVIDSAAMKLRDGHRQHLQELALPPTPLRQFIFKAVLQELLQSRSLSRLGQ